MFLRSWKSWTVYRNLNFWGIKWLGLSIVIHPTQNRDWISLSSLRNRMKRSKQTQFLCFEFWKPLKTWAHPFWKVWGVPRVIGKVASIEFKGLQRSESIKFSQFLK
jgi:hypothetical protein